MPFSGAASQPFFDAFPLPLVLPAPMKPQRVRKPSPMAARCQALRQLSISRSTSSARDLLSLPLVRHVWFCWPLRNNSGTPSGDEGIICITDHTSRRALGTSFGMMMMIGKAAVDDAEAILELVQQGMRRPMTTSSVWGKPRRPTCIVVDGLLTSCFDELRSHFADIGITVLQGRSDIGEAHSAQLNACGSAI